MGLSSVLVAEVAVAGAVVANKIKTQIEELLVGEAVVVQVVHQVMVVQVEV